MRLKSEVAIKDKTDILQAIKDQGMSEEAKLARSHMREEFKAAKQVHPLSPETVGPCETLRERILRLSLFPNIYNARELEGFRG